MKRLDDDEPLMGVAALCLALVALALAVLTVAPTVGP